MLSKGTTSLPVTVRYSDSTSRPNLLDAVHLYLPASFSRTPLMTNDDSFMRYFPPGAINRWSWFHVTTGCGEPWFGHFIITVALTTVVILAPMGAITGLPVFTFIITVLSVVMIGAPGPAEKEINQLNENIKLDIKEMLI